MNLHSLAAADGPAAVAAATPALKENFKQLVQSLGEGAMTCCAARRGPVSELTIL